MTQTLKAVWQKDPLRRGLFVGGFVYAWFFSQGIPLWDDDFTSWAWKVKDNSIAHYLWEWISPVSTQPQYWGFNERPVEALVFKIGYLISGYESWSYFLFKSFVFSLMGVMIYQWALRLVPETILGRRAALLAAVFALLTPGPMAAFILHQDLAPLAAVFMLSLSYWIWREVELTPTDWVGLPKFSDPVHRRWLLRWAGVSFCVYLSYKSKADLKLLPLILGLYILLVRRRQWLFFAFPLALMLLLAVPWGPGIFSKLPPFVPGSSGSEIGWMWQPASVERLREFFWSSAPYDFLGNLKAPTLSLAGYLGPFLLAGMLAYLGWRMEAFDKVPWLRTSEPSDRARIFILCWIAVLTIGISALPAINYTFRIRYGILTIVPFSILMSWAFGLFADSVSANKLPKWAVGIAIALFSVQSAVNLKRSITYRRDMGQVMVAVDQVYEHVNTKYPDVKLTLSPDFRPYDYRPNASKIFQEKEWLQATDDLSKKHKPLKTYVISWKPSLWDQLELVGHFPGCREYVLFDRIFRCSPGSGAHLMRFIGADPLYGKGEDLRSKGKFEEAFKVHQEYVDKYPGSMAGYFVLGLEAFQLKRWDAAERAYSTLERYFPDHLAILYNRALALVELKRYSEGIDRFNFILEREPTNYPVLLNLYWAYAKNQQPKRAKDLLVQMKRMFPDDGEVNRLLATAGS